MIGNTVMDRGVPLAERRERFCGHMVETGGHYMRSYRLAFVPDEGKTAKWIADQAQALLDDPAIALRIQEMRDEAAAQTLVTAQMLLRDWLDIAQADATKISNHIRTCCRFCWGIGHGYQWGRESDYAEAVDKAIKLQQPLPDCSGGFGFNETLDPCDSCPSCFGQGIGSVWICDTRKLTGGERKLYRGVKQTRNGIEVILADQDAARRDIAKLMGWYKEGAAAVPAQTPAQQQAQQQPMSQEEATRHYLTLLEGGKRK